MRSGFYIIGIALFLLAGTSHANPSEQRRYAVIIGNNVGRAGDGELLYAHRDATRFASIMRKFGGLPAESTMLLLGDSSAEIRRALLKMNERIREENGSNPNSSALIVYYSGHADADGLHPGKQTLPYSELRSVVRGSAATLRVLILDGCRSGEITSVKGGRQTKEFDIALEGSVKAEGVVMISSSAAGEDSHESGRLRGSFFTHHFINALVGAGDEDNNAKVTLQEAYGYAYRNTLRASGRTSQLQHPTYSYDLKGRNDFAMTELATNAKGGKLQLGAAGTYLVFRGKEGGELVAELNLKSEGSVLLLPAGTYFVQRRASDYYEETKVKVASKEVSYLQQQPSEKIRYARLVRKGAMERTNSAQFYSMVGGRAELIDGLGPSAGFLVGYQLDLPMVSLGVRGRFNASSQQPLSEALQVRHVDFGLGLSAQRFFDLRAFSLGLGLIGELNLHQQSFEGMSPAKGRQALGYAFGAIATAQWEVGEQWALMLEGGALTHLFRQAETSVGQEEASATSTTFAPWASLGLAWMF